MSSPTIRMEDRRVLETLGLTPLEEQIYTLLLDAQSSDAAGLARSSGASRERVRRAIASLSERGLVTPSAGGVAPVDPELALGVLVRRRQEELDEARRVSEELAGRFRASMTRRAPTQVLEVVTGTEAVVRRFVQLQELAKEEILLLDRPPYALDPLAANPDELAALARGVSVRVIYDERGLEVPGRIGSLRELATAGERGRFRRDVPLKLVIADQRLALIPLTREEPGVEGVVVLHESGLLAALVMFFEMLWSSSAPLPLEGDPARVGARDDQPDTELISLLAMGMKDETIARNLGVTVRTVTRRVARMMDALGARTRFQAGMRAAEGGRDQRGSDESTA